MGKQDFTVSSKDGVTQTTTGGDTSFKKSGGGPGKSYDGGSVNTSAAGLGAYAKKHARPTPRATASPTPTARPIISSTLDTGLGKK